MADPLALIDAATAELHQALDNLAAARAAIPAPTPPAPTPPPTGTVLFDGSFNKCATIADVTRIWGHVSDPDPASPHPPKIIKDPTGIFGDNVLALTVDPTDGYTTGSGAQSSRVDVYKGSDTALAREGLEIWFRWQWFFPSANGGKTGGLPPYRPTNGDWNWLGQWHNASSLVGNAGGNGQEWISGITTNSTTDPANPRFHFRAKGGWTDGKGDGTKIVKNEYIGTPLVYDAWHEVLGHTIWSKDPAKGLHEIWLNGVKLATWHMPTLIHTDTVDDVPNIEASNYRWMGQAGGVTWASTYFIRKAIVGTTREVVVA